MDIAIYRDILKLFEGIPKTDVRLRVHRGTQTEVERNPTAERWSSGFLMVRTVPRIAGRV